MIRLIITEEFARLLSKNVFLDDRALDFLAQHYDGKILGAAFPGTFTKKGYVIKTLKGTGRAARMLVGSTFHYKIRCGMELHGFEGASRNLPRILETSSEARNLNYSVKSGSVCLVQSPGYAEELENEDLNTAIQIYQASYQARMKGQKKKSGVKEEASDVRQEEDESELEEDTQKTSESFPLARSTVKDSSNSSQPVSSNEVISSNPAVFTPSNAIYQGYFLVPSFQQSFNPQLSSHHANLPFYHGYGPIPPNQLNPQQPFPPTQQPMTIQIPLTPSASVASQAPRAKGPRLGEAGKRSLIPQSGELQDNTKGKLEEQEKELQKLREEFAAERERMQRFVAVLKDNRDRYFYMVNDAATVLEAFFKDRNIEGFRTDWNELLEDYNTQMDEEKDSLAEFL